MAFLVIRPKRPPSVRLVFAEPTYTVEEAVESIGFGRFHVLLFVILGSSNVRTDGRRPPTSARQKQTPEPRACVRVCVQIVEAMEIMLLAVASPEIRCEWRLDDWQVALVSTVSRIPSVGWKLPFLPTPTFVFLNSVFFPTCFSIFPPSDGVGILHTLRKMLFGSCSCLPVCFQMVFLGFMVCGALGGYVADRYGRWKVAHGLARRASRSLSRRGLVCMSRWCTAVSCGAPTSPCSPPLRRPTPGSSSCAAWSVAAWPPCRRGQPRAHLHSRRQPPLLWAPPPVAR